MRRFARVIGVRPDKLAEYKELHLALWPEVLETIKVCNISNYSIYRHENLLFSYFEYTGVDFEGDMAKMAADPKTQEWWRLTDPCQIPLGDQKWLELEEVFHRP